ncbi:MAG: hypothetical protein EOR76_34170, partial [Mesorhizobium sp.]
SAGIASGRSRWPTTGSYRSPQILQCTNFVFTEDGIDNLRHIVDERRAAGHAPPKPSAENRRPKS